MLNQKLLALGGLTPARFLREYWQKKPLLIRNALPAVKDVLTKEKLIALAASDETQSRLVAYQRGKWSLTQGPFLKRDFAKLPDLWTLLVQGVNHFVPEAEQLLRAFNFIPYARLDDVMVSYATDGGGVGPHIDSYDVFLLQGSGKRLWKVSQQKDQRLVPDAPLRILKKFIAEDEWLLEAGDMLYLPPNYAHHGVAVGECMTYSIGFRAPSHRELVNEFLVYLLENLEVEGMYADPDLKVLPHPARIPDAMIKKVAKVLKNIRFDQRDIGRFLGRYLSEPKPNIYFDEPVAPLSLKLFLQRVAVAGVKLSLKSQMLFTDEVLFVNGEVYPFTVKSRKYLQRLADKREIAGSKGLVDCVGDCLYEWYLAGYVCL